MLLSQWKGDVPAGSRFSVREVQSRPVRRSSLAPNRYASCPAAATVVERKQYLTGVRFLVLSPTTWGGRFLQLGRQALLKEKNVKGKGFVGSTTESAPFNDSTIQRPFFEVGGTGEGSTYRQAYYHTFARGQVREDQQLYDRSDAVVAQPSIAGSAT